MVKPTQTSAEPTNYFDHLWNDLPDSERHRLMPHIVEAQYLHIWQVKQTAINAHKKHMAELDHWMSNLRRSIDKYKSESANKLREDVDDDWYADAPHHQRKNRFT